jgi:hypothetical protein
MKASLIPMICASLLLCHLANGNPHFIGDVYISSEHLAIKVSPEQAEFAGTFTFHIAESEGASQELLRRVYARIFLPIWLHQAPDQKYSVLASGPRPQDASPGTTELAKTLGLKVMVGTQNQEHVRFWEGLPLFVGEANPDPELRIVSFEFFFPPGIFTNDAPVTISYRQPCLRSNGHGNFFYMPIFESLPAHISTADTNRYAITIMAEKGCSSAVTNGGDVFTLRAGQSIVCSPKASQPIRGRVWYQ